MYRRLLSLAFAALVATACDSTNPVAPSTDNTGGGSSETLTVSVSSDRGRLEASSTQGATLTVTARKRDGSPAPDGTEVALNTSLGNFGTDEGGKPIQLVKAPLAGGRATVPFYAGAETGTANILAQVGTSVGRLNLPIVEASAPPVAEFTFEASGLSVLFTDASTGTPAAWSWDFGDGKTSTAQSPLHTYSEAGSYAVSLLVTSPAGQSTRRKFVTVEAGDPLIADFSFELNGLSTLFSDESAGKPTRWSWDFGDGKSSTAKSPSHTYARPGTYAVSLTITNAFGVSDSTSKFVTPSLGEAPVADFLAETDGLRALFTDTSTNRPTSWRWDFGDGTTSTAQNPEHAYAREGTFNVTLTAINAAGQSSKSKFVAVSLGDPPEADFEFQVNGLNVVFVDRSKNKPTAWSWDFGECAGAQCRSTEQNPSYTYQKPGRYTVILTATNAAGSSRATKLVTVASAAPPVAGFCYKRNKLVVIFTDTSTQSPTSWQWDFGDCATNEACRSTAQHPGHTYAEPGTYAVTLTATNAAGQSTNSKFVQVDTTTVDVYAICLN